jgi:hypothetical protein
MAGITAFQEAYMSASDDSDFSSYAARKMRYLIFWSFFENTAYRSVHTWSTKFKADYGLYKYTRAIYNPAHRLGDFWQTHLWGGVLDVVNGVAGDGGALPIVTDNNTLRESIAKLWQDTNWQISKDVVSLWGATLGDVMLKVIDDTERKRMYLSVVHPSTLSELERDARGNVRGYTLTETRADPRGGNRDVTYTETAERDGENVVYRTYLNNDLYAWNGAASEWFEPYGFVPMVTIQHNNVGLSWGWSELHAAMSKMREVDDQASKLSDHIRKYVDPAWLATGIQKAANTPTVTNSAATSTRPEPGREEMKILYANAGADIKPFVASLDLPGALQHVTNLLSSLEDDYPELRIEKLRLSGDITGRAMQLAQQPAEAKVLKRRAGYDDALRRAHQMAIAIGGWRGYDGYKGFNLESYKAGDLDHSIGERTVFQTTKADKLEEDKLFWETAQAAYTGGGEMGLTKFLQSHGYSDADIASVLASPQFAVARGNYA